MNEELFVGEPPEDDKPTPEYATIVANIGEQMLQITGRWDPYEDAFGMEATHYSYERPEPYAIAAMRAPSPTEELTEKAKGLDTIRAIIKAHIRTTCTQAGIPTPELHNRLEDMIYQPDQNRTRKYQYIVPFITAIADVSSGKTHEKEIIRLSKEYSERDPTERERDNTFIRLLIPRSTVNSDGSRSTIYGVDLKETKTDTAIIKTVVKTLPSQDH